jgi:hypothetical protein
MRKREVKFLANKFYTDEQFYQRNNFLKTNERSKDFIYNFSAMMKEEMQNAHLRDEKFNFCPTYTNEVLLSRFNPAIKMSSGLS